MQWDYLNINSKIGTNIFFFIFLSRFSTSTLLISRRESIFRRILGFIKNTKVWVLDIIISIAVFIIISIITSAELLLVLILVSPLSLFYFFLLNIFRVLLSKGKLGE